MNQPLVTIWMPTFNHELFIAKAIESALFQGYENVEVLVGDDCSTDATWSIVSEYIKKFPYKVKGYRNDCNQGITSNCNKMLDYVSGNYIAFSSGDDLILKGRIEKQVQWFLKNPESVLCSSGVKVVDFESNRDLGVFHDKDFVNKSAPWKIFMQKNQLAGTRFMINWDKSKHLRFDYRTPVVSDWLFFNEAVLIGPYGAIEDVGAIYHRHSGNTTARGIKKAYLDDRLIATDILFSKYGRYYFSMRVQRSHIYYFAARRYLADYDIKSALKFSFFSIMEAPLCASKAWIMLPILIMLFLGVDFIKYYDKYKHVINKIKGH